MTDVTQILSQIEHGDPVAAERLLPLVYDELRKFAAAKMRHEADGHTLDATALVNEAWLKLNADSFPVQERVLPGGRGGDAANSGRSRPCQESGEAWRQ